MSKRGIYWFRNNLRLTDNPSLVKACNECDELLLVFAWDERWNEQHIAGFPMMSDLRKRFLLETLHDLNNQLQAHGQRLHLLEGSAPRILTALADLHNIDRVFASREVGWYEQQAEAQLAEMLTTVDDQSLIREADLPFPLFKLSKSFTGYRKKVEADLRIRDAEGVATLPPPIELEPTPWPEMPAATPDSRTAFPYAGGELQAKQRVADYFEKSRLLSSYKETRNQLIGADFSSKLSPFLAVGALSPVTAYQAILDYEDRVEANGSTYWLFFELLWRDYFRMVSLKFGRSLFLDGGIKHTPRATRHNHKLFHRWTTGTTGSDFVDANMRELAATGWMSNRGRQNVASFFVHTLELPWQWGAAWFESALIDYDVSSNWGNWMYLAGVGNDPRDRVFNVDGQAQRYDADGAYRRLWLS